MKVCNSNRSSCFLVVCGWARQQGFSATCIARSRTCWQLPTALTGCVVVSGSAAPSLRQQLHTLVLWAAGLMNDPQPPSTTPPHTHLCDGHLPEPRQLLRHTAQRHISTQPQHTVTTLTTTAAAGWDTRSKERKHGQQQLDHDASVFLLQVQTF